MRQSESFPHSRSLRLHRQMEGPGTYFVTKNLQPRNPVIDEVVASEICDALCFYSERNEISLATIVVMLDHWHALLATCDGKTISMRMKLLGRWLSRKTGGRLFEQGCAWQDGFHDTRIRSAKQFQFVCGYIEENPVRAGLVETPSDWPWSSANVRYKSTLTRPWPWRFEKET
jgi:putative transposase